MIKIGLLGCLVIFMTSCASPALSTPAPALTQPPQEVFENSFLVTITTPPYTISKDSEGFDIIQMDDFSPRGGPGEPAIPAKVFQIAVPPNALMESLVVQVVDYQSTSLEGTYKLKEMVADQASGEGDQEGGSSDSTGEEINPADVIRQLEPGQMRKWLFTQVAFSPFVYDIQTGKLNVVSEVKIQIGYELSSEVPDQELLADTGMDDLAKELLINFKSAQEWYKPQE